jgi:hypothetical protein
MKPSTAFASAERRQLVVGDRRDELELLRRSRASPTPGPRVHVENGE